jgi:hypothetical protein
MDQMRSYTINKGMMDSWIKLFESGIKPAHEAVGMPVVATWVNADRNQFVWVRRFPEGADVPTLEAALRGSEGFKALNPPFDHIAKMDVQNMEQGNLAA